MKHSTPTIDKQIRRSGVDEMIALLVEAQTWRLRLVELTFASVIVFWLGFFIAVRCL
ncbi:hypothetical protein G6L00_06190 [Agrobacterium rhizogenes]|nr:hypothetical protein [Rhizobium rhizogenes]